MVKFTEVEEIGGSYHTKRNGKVCFSSYDISYLQRIFVRLLGHSSQQVATGDKWFDKLTPYLELQVVFHTNQVEICVSVNQGTGAGARDAITFIYLLHGGSSGHCLDNLLSYLLPCLSSGS